MTTGEMAHIDTNLDQDSNGEARVVVKGRGLVDGCFSFFNPVTRKMNAWAALRFGEVVLECVGNFPGDWEGEDFRRAIAQLPEGVYFVDKCVGWDGRDITVTCPGEDESGVWRVVG